ncbi:MAG: ABC transporter substrate-binding protein [Acidimicrobiales bacterium]|nr:ABC transporter substrate-binding protein [Acidimicrobiales bacterium]
MNRLRRALALATLPLVVLAACGDDTTDTTETTATEPAATDAATTEPDATEPGATEPGAVDTTADTDGAADEVPQRIVSLSPTATEMLFAIGAGDQVIAVDDQSNFPAEAAAVASDLSGFEPNVEAISAYEPDLVLHDGTTALGDSLDTLGIPHWIGPAAVTFDDIYAQLEQLGAATGHVAEAAELVAQMTTDIDAALASLPEFEVAPSFYHELDPTFYSVTSNTFIGQVYSLFGLRNVADTAEGGSDYPQLSAEFLISQSPDLIFLADTKCCGESIDTVAVRPGWDAIAAVANGDVIELDDDVASRWGPRVVDLIETIAAGVQALAQVPAG